MLTSENIICLAQNFSWDSFSKVQIDVLFRPVHHYITTHTLPHKNKNTATHLKHVKTLIRIQVS